MYDTCMHLYTVNVKMHSVYRKSWHIKMYSGGIGWNESSAKGLLALSISSLIRNRLISVRFDSIQFVSSKPLKYSRTTMFISIHFGTEFLTLVKW